LFGVFDFDLGLFLVLFGGVVFGVYFVVQQIEKRYIRERGVKKSEREREQ